MPILSLALKSLLNRRATAILTIFAIAVSVTLLIGVERVRTEAKASFTSTISGTDLIVGARSGPIPLLLYSVFRIGNATNNISWRSYRDIAERPDIAVRAGNRFADWGKFFASRLVAAGEDAEVTGFCLGPGAADRAVEQDGASLGDGIARGLLGGDRHGAGLHDDGDVLVERALQ